VTTTGGLDVVQHDGAVRDAVAGCRAAGVRVSVFVDAIPEQVDASKAAGADAVEINTGPYADAPDSRRPAQLTRIAAAAERAAAAGLDVLAGHGLNYVNVAPSSGSRTSSSSTSGTQSSRAPCSSGSTARCARWWGCSRHEGASRIGIRGWGWGQGLGTWR